MKKLIVPLCLFLLALVAPPASGGGAADVEVKLRNSTPAFHGKVVSSDSECAEQRGVNLYRVKDGPNKLLGQDLTNGNGRWEILEGEQFTLKSGAYYAKAPRLRLESGTNCAGDKSRTLVVD